MNLESGLRVSSSKQNKIKHTKTSGWINMDPLEALMGAGSYHERKPADGGQSPVRLPTEVCNRQEPLPPL